MRNIRHGLVLLSLSAALLVAATIPPTTSNVMRDIATDTPRGITNRVAWKRSLGLDHSYDVRDYGADPTGAANSDTAIAVAIAAAQSAGGGEVVFPAGLYNVTKSVVVDTAGVRLRGFGSNSVIRYVGSTPLDAVVVFGDRDTPLGSGNGLADVGASHLTALGNQHATNAWLFWFVVRSRFDDLRGRDALNCFRVRWGVSCTYSDLKASGNDGAWSYVPDTGLRVDANSYNVTFVNPVLEAGLTNGIVLDRAGGCVFAGGTAEGCTNGLVVTNYSQQNSFIGGDCEVNHSRDFVFDATTKWNRVMNWQGTMRSDVAGYHNTIRDSVQSVLVVSADSTNTHISSLSFNNYTNNATTTSESGLVDLFRPTENRTRASRIMAARISDWYQSAKDQSLSVVDPSDSTRGMWLGYNGSYGWLFAQKAGVSNCPIYFPGKTGFGNSTPAWTVSVASPGQYSSEDWGQLQLTDPADQTEFMNIGYDLTNKFGFITVQKRGTVSRPLVIPGGTFVAIGTTNATHRLTVSGNASVSGTILQAGYGVWDSRFASGTGATNWAAGNHGHSGTYEPALGNPGTTGYVLSSTDAGARSWVALPAAFPGFGTSHSTAAYGDHDHSGTYEPAAGNPASDGYVFSSTASGTRSWAAVSSTATASSIAKRNADKDLEVWSVKGTGGDMYLKVDDTTYGVHIKAGTTYPHYFYGNGNAEHNGTLKANGGYKSSDGTAGVTADVTVRNSAGTGTTTLHFKSGLYVGSD